MEAKGKIMVYSPTLLFFIISGFLSAWLSFSVAYLMFKSWRMVREDYLLGFPTGFSLLALAYSMLDITYVLPLTNTGNWIRLLLSSWGFIFLAVTYHLRYSSSNAIGPAAKSFVVLALLTISSIVSVSVIPPALLPSYLASELSFTIINLLALGYIIYNLNKALRIESGLSTVVLGFTFLTIDQYSLLLNTLDRSFVWSVIFALLVRIAGLLTLTIFLVKVFQRE